MIEASEGTDLRDGDPAFWMPSIPAIWKASREPQPRAAPTSLSALPIRDPDNFNRASASPSQRYDKAHSSLRRVGVDTDREVRFRCRYFSLGRQTPGRLARRLGRAHIAGRRVREEIIRQLKSDVLKSLERRLVGHSLSRPPSTFKSRASRAENGRAMLRATNTGMTAIIRSAAGRCAQFAESHLEVRARVFGATPYVRVGNYPVVLACLALKKTRSPRESLVGEVGRSFSATALMTSN